MIVVLDQQHIGRKSRPGDRGATNGLLRETDLTRAYIDVAWAELRRQGHQVHILDTGEYAERQAQANALAAQNPAVPHVYVACHVNAGKGTYALVEHDSRSRAGLAAATRTAQALEALPEIKAGKVIGMVPATRGYACIRDIYDGPANITAILYEPGFIDAPAHQALWTPEGLRRVGMALVVGLVGG